MSLEQLSKTVDFVQDATPSNANDGETYLDTSQSPPQLKVFDGSAGSFIRPRSIRNLDAKVSSAGTGVDWSSKTPKYDQVSSGSTVSVSGSGYLVSVGSRDIDSTAQGVEIDIDGSNLNNFRFLVSETDAGQSLSLFPLRFDSSVAVTETTGNNRIVFIYVLD